MATIKRNRLTFDDSMGGYVGVVSLRRRKFDLVVTAFNGDWESAWTRAEEGAELLLSRSREIEQAVASQLSPELGHWADEPTTVADITKQVMRSVRSTAEVGLHADEQNARLYFEGPDLVLGHYVMIVLSRDGEISASLAG